MRQKDIATPEEVLETEMAVIQAAGLKVRHAGYQRGLDGGFHLYDVLGPRIPGYVYGENSGYPTLTLEGMRELGLIRKESI